MKFKFVCPVFYLTSLESVVISFLHHSLILQCPINSWFLLICLGLLTLLCFVFVQFCFTLIFKPLVNLESKGSREINQYSLNSFLHQYEILFLILTSSYVIHIYRGGYSDLARLSDLNKVIQLRSTKPGISPSDCDITTQYIRLAIFKCNI